MTAPASSNPSRTGKAASSALSRSAHVDSFARDNLPPREQWPELLLDRPELRYPERLNAAEELLDAVEGNVPLGLHSFDIVAALVMDHSGARRGDGTLRAREQIRMCHSIGGHRITQRSNSGILADDIIKSLRTILAIERGHPNPLPHTPAASLAGGCPEARNHGRRLSTWQGPLRAAAFRP